MNSSKSFPSALKKMHHNAVKAMSQASVNLELFTIPLYMTSMYSLTGLHQITGDNELYRGRWWPGIAPNATPTSLPYGGDEERLPIDNKVFGNFSSGRSSETNSQMLCSAPNNLIYNAIFKVFVEEMLHLQLASNLSRVLGVDNTSFTHPDLVTQPLSKDQPYDPKHNSYGWHCYGDNNTTIPYIVDLKDTKHPDIKVKLGALDHNQIELFKIVELPEEDARDNVREDKRNKYFPSVPFANWSDKSEGTKDLPMFGSIGHLYKCLWEYLHINYDDGTMLIDYILKEVDTAYPQHDLFNAQQAGHPRAEFPGFNATVFGSDSKYVLPRIKEMIDAITEQGEGGNVTDSNLGAVAKEDQADFAALKKDYKSFGDRGCPMASSHAYARAGTDISQMDHEEIFEFVEKQMAEKEFQTWDMWHEKGNKWTGDMLSSKDYENNKYSKAYKQKNDPTKINHALPDPKEVAEAMNRLKEKESESYSVLSQAAAGAIKGIITVLNTYWSTSNAGGIQFPYPAMGGSGDRMAICWAIFGKAPLIENGVKDRPSGKTHLNHSCQGLAITPKGGEPTHDSDICADVSIYHTCKGSNECRAEGGCGFVQQVGGGGNCGKSTKLQPSSCGSHIYFNPPADNSCGGQGGCAVPISASQLYPKPPKGGIKIGVSPEFAHMQLNDFTATRTMSGVSISSHPIVNPETHNPESFNYSKGDSVYETAWEAYTKVCASRKVEPKTKPDSSDYRLAFPPST